MLSLVLGEAGGGPVTGTRGSLPARAPRFLFLSPVCTQSVPPPRGVGPQMAGSGGPPPPRATRPGSHLPAWVRASPGLGRLAGCRMVQAAAARRLLRFALQLQLCQFSGPRVLSATPQFCAGAVVRPPPSASSSESAPRGTGGTLFSDRKLEGGASFWAL